MVVKVSMSVPNDSHMITMPQSEAPIRLMMPGSAQWLCFLLPLSSILPSRSISSSISADAAAPRAFPKRKGAWTRLTLFAPGLAARNTACWSSANPRLPCSHLCTPPLVPKIFRPFGSGSGFQQSNRQQAIPISAALEGPGCPRLRHDYSKLPCYRMPAMTMRSHRRGDACPVEHGVSSD